MKRTSFAALLLALAAAVGAAPKIIVSHAISVHGQPKYKAGFSHFDYVNPDAPKGGTLRLATLGTYDNFNRYAQRGVADAGSGAFYDSLMTSSLDEAEVYYGLIAEKIEYPDDYTWVIFYINPKARFQDGKAITADDVVFSYNKFLTEGVPFFKQRVEPVAKVEALDERRVKFTLSTGNRDLLVYLAAALVILPPQYWRTRNLAEPLTEVPLGSGAYAVKDYKIGQYTVYERLKDYWGRDLPVNKGQLNFDFERYDYYRDENVALEALKAGEYDYREENVAKNWATLYSGPAFDSGQILKEEIPHEIPEGMPAFVFNIQRPVFQDRRVRMALNYAMDFEWMNRNLFYGQYTRSRSYFQNTEYAAKGLPSKEELAILSKVRDKIPPEVFTQEYNPPVTDGSGNIRAQIQKALELLKQAGWELRGTKLVNAKTGQPLEFELLLYSPSDERVAIPMQKNLERMGVTMNIRTMSDYAQLTKRLRDRDFDMISDGYPASFFPSADLKIVWRSDYIDSTWNNAGVQDPAVDYLIDGIEANQNDEKALLAWGRALDRVLTWNHYVIPRWYLSKFRVAYWNKFGRPAVRPKYALGIGTWWVDRAKEAKLPRR